MMTDTLIKAEHPTRHAQACATSADSIPLRLVVTSVLVVAS